MNVGSLVILYWVVVEQFWHVERFHKGTKLYLPELKFDMDTSQT